MSAYRQVGKGEARSRGAEEKLEIGWKSFADRKPVRKIQ